MNKIILSIIGTAFSLVALAQPPIDRSKQPKAGPPPSISIKDPVIFDMPNGMKVLVVENHKLPKVSATINIDRGPVLEGQKAGIMNIMGVMLLEGTTKTPKAKFDESIDLMGAELNLYSTGGSASSLTRYFNQTFLMMAEAIQHPAFPQESFDKIKTQSITGLKSGEKSAAAISSRVVGALSYGKNTAMGEFETEESIKGLTLADVKTAYAESITPSRSYLTFVGDITPAEAKALTQKAFGDWKGKKLELPAIPNADNVKGTEIDFIDLPTAVQGEIRVTNLINNPMSSPDYHSLLIANQILGGGSESKLFMNLREKHGFTYGSYSNVGSGRFQSQFSSSAQVRSEKADSAIQEMMKEIDNMQKGAITPEELAIAKAKFNGSFALGMEDPARAASYASNILINNLPKDFYSTYLQKVNAVSVTDVQKVSKKYFDKDNSRIIVVGNGEKILPNLTRLGYPIKKYDKYANPIVDKPADANIKESEKNTEAISAFSVIDGYLKAIGGKEEAKKVNTIKSSVTMDMMGRTIEGTDMKMMPNKHYTEMKMGEMKVFQSSFNGSKGYQAQMGQKKEMDEKEIKEALDDKGVIPQLYYLTSDYQTSYLGIGKVGSEDCYKLKITKPSGKTTVEYYATKTNLLLREESTSDAGGTEMSVTTDYSNYKKVGNLMFPFNIVQTAGEQEFNMTVTDLKINEGVTEADFNQ
jgi:predicted Zn-dependent peptidase